ncbi:Mur ligase family protein [Fluviispira multicolorata]|uniref:UDP-N-acetylmuramate--L-alanine ligase n=1 Tax=Fluviispira multicolorata TaxID=2654512 RepID=A0A833N478_9BACT|nr:Mur ligase family protein [Fluviispira multicolorata]KAB8031746.1 hypothetical protein GCL57_03660 [Fluviispira multicolorata]
MIDTKHIAIVHPAGKVRINDKERLKNINKFEEMGFLITEIKPEQDSLDGCTSSPILERAMQLSHALTMRKYKIIFAAKGGVGCTELIPFLENLLPPVLPCKTLVGFSDISFLGIYLSLRYPNFRYIHGQNAFSSNLFTGPMLDQKVLFDLLNEKEAAFTFNTSFFHEKIVFKNHKINGVCIPLNLSLAESLSSLKHIELPEHNILFLEDCNEHLYRIIRKIDSLINSNFLINTKAIVLGNFTQCLDAQEKEIERSHLIKIIAHKTSLPILDLPIFGHDEYRFPLVAKAKVIINLNNSAATISITNKLESNDRIATNFPTELYCKKINNAHEKLRIHMTGIGGTGMAQVAGLLKSAGYKISGSDNPIYPPMDKIIADLGIHPEIGFLNGTIQKYNPDAIVLANVVSRISASLKKNDELEDILRKNIPVLSFPSALRKYFLSQSRNIIVSGTHGKTTTSSLITHVLTELKENPSFLIGGRPANFDAGFALRSRDLFVLEGDEYDSAFFDKGPKFLHYEPKISLINNIEFDHADIYPNVEAIESEFLRLAKLTKERNGIVVANLDDSRSLKCAKESKAHVIGFSANKNIKNHFPHWLLKGYKTFSDGIEVTCLQPNGKEFKFKSGIFGQHNALNAIGVLAVLQANQVLKEGKPLKEIEKYKTNLKHLNEIKKAMKSFRGVKRRFELLQERNNITVFDDFAHHPTAIVTTLEAFRSYMKSVGKKGKLIACFDPRNATMRRRVLQDQLSQSFFHADEVLLGKVPQDMRMQKDEILDGLSVAKACGQKARYFDDNEKLLATLKQEVKPGDTIVFMSSGSFDGIPHRFAKEF